MRRHFAWSRHSRLALLACLAAAPATAFGQAQPPAAPPDRTAVVAAARDVMARARYCSLITVAADGRLQARVMDPFAPDEAMVVWMGTNIASRKVAELRVDPRATLTCFYASDQAYVTLQGLVDVVTDPAETTTRWKPEWAAFYPQGAKDPSYALLRFRTSRLELISPAHGIMNDPKTWQPVGIDLPTSAEHFVRGLYDDVSAGPNSLPDWDTVRRYFLEDAVVVLRTSRSQTTVFTLEGFIKDFVDFYDRPMKVGDATLVPRVTGFTERVVRARTWEYGDMAHVLVLYEAAITGWNRAPQQGVDSWILVRRGGEWRIAGVTNEIVTPDRPIPAELR